MRIVGEVVSKSKDFEYDLVHFVFIAFGFFQQCTPDTWKVCFIFASLVLSRDSRVSW